ncbi:sensor histidine kinase [Streptococcus pseudoporcinus]|uniref:sensor histidine kinase n=1 Tax=Streptococcus pseudoporcinus TaxID=361101 RepID=UPI000984701F|nr:HAMP domain-containing sensor histidine kinase [Streptococcus pseudoporcinus]VUC95523.1 sensor histidine kinase [Streptococcus pseudoporcinus]VUC95918.1 sensor histidine kinase [Streptococcus pseudoporcinus]
MKRKNLINHMFLINSIMLFLSFCMIYISLNYVAKNYVHDMTKNAMKSNFTILDSINAHKNIPDNPTKNQDSVFVWAYYTIYDDKQEIKYANEPQKKESLQILDYLKQHHLKPNRRKGLFIPIKKKTYYVMRKDYDGVFEDGLVTKTGTKQDRTYHVINFADITYTQNLINQINFYLIVSLVLMFIIMLFIMGKTFLGIRESIQSVQTFISNLWRDQKPTNTTDKHIVFSDFDPLLKESQEMTKRIRQAEASQLTFFQNASHELRTPLMSIQGYTEGMKEGIIQEELAYTIILQESQKMKQLVDDIMLLSRLDGSSHPKKEKILMDNLVSNYVSYFKPIAHQKGLELTYNHTNQVFAIGGNEELLQKAITNIVSNALRYAKRNINITLKANQVIIENDGPAISSKDLPHIFERFYKGKEGQTGIGLAMVKEIMHQHKGDILVNSQANKTQFILVFDCHTFAT